MYVWVVLLFALVTIMTYKMSARQDDFERRTMPAVETVIAPFIKQHEAAVKYFKNNTFTNKQWLTWTQLQKYVPNGLSDSTAKYKSLVLCVDPTNGSLAVANCNSSLSVAFAITYGDIPSRWTDEKMEPFFLNAIGRYTGKKANVGKVEAASPKPTTGTLLGVSRIIRASGGSSVYVPQLFKCSTGAGGEGVDPLGKLMYITRINGEDTVIAAPSTCN